MPVITFVSPKGGVGKTTSALILGCELARRGDGVILIDADPNKPIAKWGQLQPAVTGIEIVEELDEDEIINAIDKARRKARWVLVDLEGRASARVTNALLMSDLALVPMQGSALDAAEAARAFKSIKNAAVARQRPLPAAAVLTRTPASKRLWSRDLKQLEANLTAAGIRIVPTALAERGAFKGIFSVGGTIETLDPSAVSSLDSAKANAREFASDVLELLEREAV